MRRTIALAGAVMLLGSLMGCGTRQADDPGAGSSAPRPADANSVAADVSGAAESAGLKAAA